MGNQVTLSDEDYAALRAAAAQRGESVETLLHAAIASQYPESFEGRSQQGAYIQPTRAPIDAALAAEMERLAAEIGAEQPWLSDMVIEDRGPR